MIAHRDRDLPTEERERASRAVEKDHLERATRPPRVDHVEVERRLALKAQVGGKDRRAERHAVRAHARIVRRKDASQPAELTPSEQDAHPARAEHRAVALFEEAREHPTSGALGAEGGLGAGRALLELDERHPQEHQEPERPRTHCTPRLANALGPPSMRAAHHAPAHQPDAGDVHPAARREHVGDGQHHRAHEEEGQR